MGPGLFSGAMAVSFRESKRFGFDSSQRCLFQAREAAMAAGANAEEVSVTRDGLDDSRKAPDPAISGVMRPLYNGRK